MSLNVTAHGCWHLPWLSNGKKRTMNYCCVPCCLIMKCIALVCPTFRNRACLRLYIASLSMSYYKQTHREKKKEKLYESIRIPICESVYYYLQYSSILQPMVSTCWDVSEIPQEGDIDAIVYFPFSFFHQQQQCMRLLFIHLDVKLFRSDSGGWASSRATRACGRK